MRIRGIFLFLALWGFGATAFALGAGAHRWWFAVAAGALTILALLGAVVAEFAEEYRRRGVAERRTYTHVRDQIDEMGHKLASMQDTLDEITGYLATIAEAQTVLHPNVQFEDRPVVAPFAPLPAGRR